MDEKRLVTYRKTILGIDLIHTEIFEGSLERIRNNFSKSYYIISIVRFLEKQ